MSDTKPPVRFLRSSLHIPAVNDRRKLSLWHFHDYVLTEFPPTLQCELQKINQNLCLCSFAQGEAAGGGLRADPESHQPQTGVLTHTNTSDRLTITQTTTVTPPIIIMKLLTCNSHSNFLPLDAGTNRASSPQTRACTEQPSERESYVSRLRLDDFLRWQPNDPSPIRGNRTLRPFGWNDPLRWASRWSA